MHTHFEEQLDPVNSNSVSFELPVISNSKQLSLDTIALQSFTIGYFQFPLFRISFRFLCGSAVFINLSFRVIDARVAL